MKKVYQTKTRQTHKHGNCLMACIASLVECDINDIHETTSIYDPELQKNLIAKGYHLIRLYPNHIKKDMYYIQLGGSPITKGVNHACIYKNGKLVHDPYKDNKKLLDLKAYSEMWGICKHHGFLPQTFKPYSSKTAI